MDHRAFVAEYCERLRGRCPVVSSRSRPHPACATGQGGLFSTDEVRRIIDQPPLRLVQPIDDRVWDSSEAAPVDRRVDRVQVPHMLLKHDEAILTSLFVFLEKRG